MTPSDRGLFLLRAFALAALGAAAVMTLASARRFPEWQRRFAAKEQAMEELRALGSSMTDARPWRLALEALPPAALPPPAALFKKASATEEGPEVHLSSAASDEPGWTCRRAEVVFSETRLDLLGPFMQACETARPPWRVVAVRLGGRGAVAGRGPATVRLEGWERTKP